MVRHEFTVKVIVFYSFHQESMDRHIDHHIEPSNQNLEMDLALKTFLSRSILLYRKMFHWKHLNNSKHLHWSILVQFEKIHCQLCNKQDPDHHIVFLYELIYCVEFVFFTMFEPYSRAYPF